MDSTLCGHVALCALGVVSACAAQDASRVTLLGRITPREGTTWADATVHVVSLGPPWRAEASDESLTLRADENGRFRVQVRARRRYAVWASTATKSGVVRITNLEPSARGGVPIRLREQTPSVAKSIAVRGFDAWRAVRGLRYRVLVLGTSAVHTGPFALDEHGRFTPPPLPPGRTYLTVSDASGCVVVPQTRLPADSIPMLQPVRVRYRIVDRTNGKPIADAKLLRLDRVQRRWREIGCTKPDGTCELMDVAPREYGQIVYIHAAGYRELASNTAGTRQRDGSPVTNVKLELMPAASIRGRLRVTDKIAGARIPLILAAPGVFSNGHAGGWQRAFWTKEDGSFLVLRPGYNEELRPAWQFAIFASLRADQLEVLDRATSSPEERKARRADRFPLFRYVPLAYGNVSGDSALSLDLRDVCLSRWTRVNVTAFASDGRPARFARINLNVIGAAPGFRAGLPESAITDRRGRLSLVLPPAPWILSVASKQETYLTTLDLRKDAKPRIAVRGALEPPRYVTGFVRGADGKPIENAVVGWRSASRPDDFGIRNVVNSLSRVVRTDGKGRFRLAVPAVCRGYSVGAYLGSRYTPRVEVPPEGETPKDLELTLR